MAIVGSDAVSAGFDGNGLERTMEILDEGVEAGLYPGGAVWVSRRGVDALVYGVGVTRFGGDQRVDEHTVFDLASLTKPVACASAVLLLAQEGRLHLGTEVSAFFAERRLRHLAGVTLRHLLTHTSGLPAWKDMYSDGQDRARVIDELFDIPLAHQPSATYVYSCLGYIMLSLVVERVSGQALDAFCQDRIFGPLAMADTGYNPNTTAGRAIAATANCPLRKKELIGEVHDGNACALGGVSGNAGLFSTAGDLAIFCHSITSRRSEGPLSPLKPPALRGMYHNAISESVGGQTLGWFTYPNGMMCAGDLVSKAAISHSGFTGTAIIVDSEHDLFAILLTNRVCRNDDGSAFRDLRRRLFNSVVGAIVC